LITFNSLDLIALDNGKCTALTDQELKNYYYIDFYCATYGIPTTANGPFCLSVCAEGAKKSPNFLNF